MEERELSSHQPSTRRAGIAVMLFWVSRAGLCTVGAHTVSVRSSFVSNSIHSHVANKTWVMVVGSLVRMHLSSLPINGCDYSIPASVRWNSSAAFRVPQAPTASESVTFSVITSTI
ncbi:hypothetical protein RHGRI_035916 [Rhododendron griersonianum]|uniref:Secreted protein n=1 Tax=Rhododendron griersonianum TaxID=479676 RepID=A0AAV6HLF7_9ERIC|nr:hypothetical protein RHGRI_035916 [Rhododendron griersonianum]